MSETVFNTFPPPASDAKHGYVVGRLIRRVGDTTLDPDLFVDASNVQGTVTFTPAQRQAKSSNYSAFVFRDPITVQLDELGHIMNTTQTARGIWLTIGVWTVSFQLRGVTMLPFDFEVTEDYTEGRPLDLVTVAPYTPSTKESTNLLMVPIGGKGGDVLIKNDDGTVRWESYWLKDVTVADIKGDKGDKGDIGPVGPGGPAGQLNLSENMILNGCVELGTNQYWGTGATVSTTDIPPGSNLMRSISYPAGAATTRCSFPPVPTAASETYQLEFWIKADTAGSKAYFDMTMQTGSRLYFSDTLGGTEHDRPISSYEVPTTWTKIVRYLRTTTSTNANNKIAQIATVYQLFLNHADGTNKNASVSLAGLRMVPVSVSVVQDRSITPDKLSIDAVSNPTNSFPDPDVLSATMWNPAAGITTVVGGGMLAGGNARRITATGALLGAPAVPFSITPGTYELSCYIKSSTALAAKSTGNPHMALHKSPPSVIVALTRDAIPANVWTRITGMFTVADTDGKVAIGTFVQPTVPAGTTVDFSRITINRVPDMALVPAKTITGSQLADKTVDRAQLADGSVGKAQLSADAIAAMGTGSRKKVRDFGAKGDGVTDDIVAFENCAAAAGVNGTIEVADGQYRLSRTFTLPATATMVGDNLAHADQPTTGAVINVDHAGVGISTGYGQIVGLAVHGPYKNGSSPATSIGIKWSGGGKLEDVTIVGFNQAVQATKAWYAKIKRLFTFKNMVGLYVDNCYNMTLTDCRLQSKTDDGNLGRCMDLLNNSWVTCYGTSFESFAFGAYIHGNGSLFSSNGGYFETQSGASVNSGVFVEGTGNTVNLNGNTVYLNYIPNFVNAAVAASAGSVVNGSGNLYIGTVNPSAIAHVYFFVQGVRGSLFGDSVYQVTGANFKYCNITPPYVNPFVLPNGASIG